MRVPESFARFHNFIRKITVFFLLFSFVFSPLATTPLFAQETGPNTEAATSTTPIEHTSTDPATSTPDTAQDSPDEVSESDQNATSTPGNTATSTPENENPMPAVPPLPPEAVATTTATTTPVIPGTKFKKDNSLSQTVQLAAVRQHLIDQKLPQTALDRLTAFETEQKEGPQKDGILTKIVDFVTGNTDEAKERREAIAFAKKEPFKVESFEGAINTAPADRYERDFSDAKEQASFIQKIRNFIENGSFLNPDFDQTKEKEEGIISRLFSPKKAIADASDNPNDYLGEGNEITFSQAIKEQADALGNDPLTMFNFVRNEVAYIPYYGSKKGSDATLVELAGNDMDKASLLIAMLRYSTIPARYRHVDAKMDINTVTGLLGVDSPIAAAQILSLEKIPYTLYTINDEPAFFVVEHIYVEAYLPYGVTRGADINDGGTPQWVPMDPTITTYNYERPVDIVDHMNGNGFIIHDFFDNYLEGEYAQLEPLDALKSEVENILESHSPDYFPGLTYEDAIVHAYPEIQNFEFIPGSLPFEISANLNTYDFAPSALRHTVAFTVTDKNDILALEHTAYLSDFADKELLVTYVAATPEDQETIDSFETMYDVVPLSLVAVKPVVKVNGNVITLGTSTTTLGQSQKYKLAFYTPKRTIGNPVNTEEITSFEKKTISGNTDAIALNTDRVIPPEFRPAEDTETTSFASNQKLYSTALDYLNRLQSTEKELADIIGGDFTHVATKASVFNGIEVTYSNNEPYSFEWTGLRIDAVSGVRYFNRFKEPTNTHLKEFLAVFGLQASQDEADIFEDNFDVESVSTVKGLKLVSDGQFSGVTLKKITEANESEIDSLAISTNTKTIFHTAIEDGRIIYTPSAPVTYQNWNGLFYITIDFDGGDASYTIGEGLNGGHTVVTVEQWPQGWRNIFYRALNLVGLTATITHPLNGETFIKGKEDIHFSVDYSSSVHDWPEDVFVSLKNIPLGTLTLKSGYRTNASVTVKINPLTVGTPAAGGNNTFTYDKPIEDSANPYDFPAGVLKAIVGSESSGKNESTRYEPCQDIGYKNEGLYDGTHPEFSYYLIGGNGITEGAGATNFSQFKDNINKYSPKQMIAAFSLEDFTMPTSKTPTVYEVWNTNIDFYGKCTVSPTEGNYPAQFLVATSYGEAQILYSTAIEQGFNKKPGTNDDYTPPKNPWYLFFSEASLDLAAKTLQSKYNFANDKNWGQPGNDCKVKPYDNQHFINTYGTNWVTTLEADYDQISQRWEGIQNTLISAKDRLWWAVRLYNGLAPSTIRYANNTCGTYHLQNP